MNFAAQRLISQRKLEPKMAPMEIMSTSLKLRTIDFSYTKGRSYQRARRRAVMANSIAVISFYHSMGARQTLCRLLLYGGQTSFAHDRISLHVKKLSRFHYSMSNAAFVPHSDLLQHPPRPVIALKVAGENTLELKILKSILDQRARRFCRITFAPERHTNPVTQLRPRMLHFGMQSDASTQPACAPQADG